VVSTVITDLAVLAVLVAHVLLDILVVVC
jgi:hypothetical protein